ncbi:hypothetical protein C8Q75DRAFT_806420 [Abortiporus biennis]|nr:hypothetical protein C8Q75DRAFT_806420 [Abortiporus biennis]
MDTNKKKTVTPRVEAATSSQVQDHDTPDTQPVRSKSTGISGTPIQFQQFQEQMKLQMQQFEEQMQLQFQQYQQQMQLQFKQQLQQIDQRLKHANVNDKIQKIQKAIQDIQEQVNHVDDQLIEMERDRAQTRNMTLGTGRINPFLPVPFPDGSFPSERGLPPLRNLDDIVQLSDANVCEYHDLYYPDEVDNNATIATLRQRVKEAIGCLRVQVQPQS